ncbi:MAG: lipoyl domain-containing protein, partial [Caldilinea sp.]
MATQIIVPVMGEAIGEARLAVWLKQVGDPVRRGDELAELETDKATLTLECPADGVLLEILIGEGAMVNTGQLLAQVGR